MSALPNYITTEGRGEGSLTPLIGLVSRGMTKNGSVGGWDRSDRFYASDAGFCPRQAALKSQGGGSIDNPASFLAYCELGNTIEDLVLGALGKTGNLLFKQYRLPDIGLNLGGKIDGVVVVNGKLRVLEVKSCGELPKAYPKSEHQSQALIYSAVTGLPASVLYFSRSVAKFTGELLLKEFPLDDLQDEKRAVVFRAALAYFSTRKGILPDIPINLFSAKDCGFCPFTGFCWNSEKLETKLKSASGPDGEALIEQANQFTDHLLSPNVTNDRRKGILKHIQANGGEVAKEVLKADWGILI